MNKVTLCRLETSDQGTFGRLTFNGLNLFTGELPWRDNQSNVSCIPEGLYEAYMTFSPHFKRMTYQLKGVPNRNEIRIHPANFMADKSKGFHCELNGCISLSEKIGYMDGQKSLLLSAPAVRIFENTMNQKSFLLEIINALKR